jgi:hypothetical protein
MTHVDGGMPSASSRERRTRLSPQGWWSPPCLEARAQQTCSAPPGCRRREGAPPAGSRVPTRRVAGARRSSASRAAIVASGSLLGPACHQADHAQQSWTAVHGGMVGARRRSALKSPPGIVHSPTWRALPAHRSNSALPGSVPAIMCGARWWLLRRCLGERMRVESAGRSRHCVPLRTRCRMPLIT